MKYVKGMEFNEYAIDGWKCSCLGKLWADVANNNTVGRYYCRIFCCGKGDKTIVEGATKCGREGATKQAVAATQKI